MGLLLGISNERKGLENVSVLVVTFLCNVTNFRPIALLPFIGKIFEKCISSRLLEYANRCNIFSSHQFGFLRGKSTQDAVIMLTEKIYDCLNGNDGSFCANIFIDFQKAFDTIDHEILFNKMSSYGIKEKPLDLFRSFLTGRQQRVKIDDVISSPKPLTIGLPQGSTLSAILYLIYIFLEYKLY